MSGVSALQIDSVLRAALARRVQILPLPLDLCLHGFELAAQVGDGIFRSLDLGHFQEHGFAVAARLRQCIEGGAIGFRAALKRCFQFRAQDGRLLFGHNAALPLLVQR